VGTIPSVPPAVSVVVPTRDRERSLERLLEALGAQDPGTPFEVVVVDDASSDGTTALLDRWASRSDLPVRHLRLERRRGPATARNLGWRQATGAVICFTDDDCAPHPGWVAGLVAATAEAGIVQGRTIPAPDQAGNRGPFSHTMSVPHEDGHYATCNVAYRREVLERVDGFDEAFVRPYGEDTDLAWRAIDAGATTAFVAEAVVEHDVRRSSFRAHLTDLRRRDGLVLAIAKHPRLRRLLPYRGYVRPTHLPLAVLGAAALLWGLDWSSPARVALLVVAAGWYAFVCRRWRPAPPARWQWIPALPLAVVADVVEVGVLVGASVRHRALVL
jgi:glycosyltransferase involved in cell wall biosynthesis